MSREPFMNGREALAIPRLLIAGAGSGAGKTTITCGLLACLRRRGFRGGGAVGYKVGPDYIDPGHLRRAGQCPVYNLDEWTQGRENLTGLFARTAAGADFAVVEGVMGLYDGGPGGSSAEIAKLLGLPVVLVLNARSLGESAAAVALGFREFDRAVDFRGVILNGVGSDSHEKLIAGALERLNIPLLGALRRDSALSVPERHLGLLPVEESPANDAEARIAALAGAVEAQIDVDALLAVARTAPPLSVPAETETRPTGTKPSTKPIARPTARFAVTRLAVARDEAFSFYYPESLEVLTGLGIELVFFSPLRDAALPRGANGLLLGGGFPEMFAKELSENVSMRASIAGAAKRGDFPILAECGGMLYLCRSLMIDKKEGREFPMVGVIPAACRMETRLQAVGYVEARPLRNTILGPRGAAPLRGHEFHFSSMIPDGPEDEWPYAFQFTRRRGGTRGGGWVSADGLILASYLHLNFLGSPSAASAFSAALSSSRPLV